MPGSSIPLSGEWRERKSESPLARRASYGVGRIGQMSLLVSKVAHREAHPRRGVSSARLAARGARDDARAAARRHSGGREGMRTEAPFSVAIAALPCSLRASELCAREPIYLELSASARAQRAPPRCRNTAPTSLKDCCRPLTRITM